MKDFYDFRLEYTSAKVFYLKFLHVSVTFMALNCLHVQVFLYVCVGGVIIGVIGVLGGELLCVVDVLAGGLGGS